VCLLTLRGTESRKRSQLAPATARGCPGRPPRRGALPDVREPERGALREVRLKPERLLLASDPQREPRTFRLMLCRDLGMKRSGASGSFVSETHRQAVDFYRSVVQTLRPCGRLRRRCRRQNMTPRRRLAVRRAQAGCLAHGRSYDAGRRRSVTQGGRSRLTLRPSSRRAQTLTRSWPIRGPRTTQARCHWNAVMLACTSSGRPIQSGERSGS